MRRDDGGSLCAIVRKRAVQRWRFLCLLTIVHVAAGFALPTPWWIVAIGFVICASAAFLRWFQATLGVLVVALGLYGCIATLCWSVPVGSSVTWVWLG